MKIVDKLLAVLFTVALFTLLSSVIYSYRYVSIEVGFRNLKWSSSKLTVCPEPEISREVERAVDEWNTGITYFGLRFFWPEVLEAGFKIVDSKSGDRCDISFQLIDSPLGVRGEHLMVASMKLDRDGENVRSATIYVWRGLLKDFLREDLKRVLVHELAWALGLMPPIHGEGESLGLASELYGKYSVTSLDVYALYLKQSLKDFQGKNYYGKAPVPLLRIGEAILFDALILTASVVASTLLYRVLRRVSA